ncbi:MAG: type II toxin-antitoxin system VapC family toxin [Sphingopyxis sp.]
MFLLDTNICIDFIDGRNAISRERVRENYPRGLSISSITAAELLVGSSESEDRRGDEEKVERFLTVVELLDFDMGAAQSYAELAQRIGIKRSSFDRLIAAHALSCGLILVTNNIKDFADVPGLRVENWTV